MAERFKIEDGWLPLGVVDVSQYTKWACPFSHMVVGKSYPSLDSDAVHRMVIRQFEGLVRADRPLTLNQPIVGQRYGREHVTVPRRRPAADLGCHCELDEIANGGEP